MEINLDIFASLLWKELTVNIAVWQNQFRRYRVKQIWSYDS